MAPPQRRNTNNPYKKGGGDPFKNPMVFVGGAIVMLFLIYSMLSSYDPNTATIEDERARLRSANSAGEMTKDDLEKPNQGKEDIRLQQDIVPDGDQPEPIHVEALEKYEFDETLYFNHYIKGKAGAVIEDMFMAHAYAFHMNGIYGGACRNDPTINVEKHVNLLDALGLKDSMPFACASDFHDKRPKMSIPKEHYHKVDSRIWTPAYVSYLKSLVKFPPKNENEYVIAVHVRRGDVTPCRPQNKGYYRYLPNIHYLNLIEKYNKPGARVIVFSESNAFEPLSDFEAKGYEVNLDNDLASIWKTFVSADVLILSRSDFSMMPAVCAMGQVVYTPFWHDKLKDWERVPKDIMAITDETTEKLRVEKCE